jgi:glutathione S-transferase
MSPHPQYKLYYFNVRGWAERIRYIFAYAEVPFEDIRLDHDKFRAEYKSKFPFGQVPVLEIDGGKHLLAQSTAIARYLAKQFHLTGANDLEAAEADMYVDGLGDLQTHLRPVQRAKRQKEENVYKEELEKFKAEHLKNFLDRYEKFLTTNGSGHLVGSKTTWADLAVAEFLERMQHDIDEHLLDSHPKLLEFVEKIHQNPGIKHYISQRPKSDH